MLTSLSSTGQTASQKTETYILQQLMKVTDHAKLRTYLCINEDALITALNNYQEVVVNRLTTHDIILIAASKFRNCYLIFSSPLYSTLDNSTKEGIATLLQNQKPKSHMAHCEKAPGPAVKPVWDFPF